MGIHFIDFIFVESKKKLVKAKIYMAVRLMTKKVRAEKMAFKETPRIPFFFIKILNSWLLSIQDFSKFKIRTKIVFLLRTLFNFRERIFEGLIINMYQEFPISLYAPPIFVINHIKKFLENMSPDLHRFFVCLFFFAGKAESADEVISSSEDLPLLPDFFSHKHFMLYGEIDGKTRRLLIRYITAYNG